MQSFESTAPTAQALIPHRHPIFKHPVESACFPMASQRLASPVPITVLATVPIRTWEGGASGVIRNCNQFLYSCKSDSEYHMGKDHGDLLRVPQTCPRLGARLYYEGPCPSHASPIAVLWPQVAVPGQDPTEYIHTPHPPSLHPPSLLPSWATRCALSQLSACWLLELRGCTQGLRIAALADVLSKQNAKL